MQNQNIVKGKIVSYGYSFTVYIKTDICKNIAADVET